MPRDSPLDRSLSPSAQSMRQGLKEAKEVIDALSKTFNDHEARSNSKLHEAEQHIFDLKGDLADLKCELAEKDTTIKKLKEEIDILSARAEQPNGRLPGKAAIKDHRDGDARKSRSRSCGRRIRSRSGHKRDSPRGRRQTEGGDQGYEAHARQRSSSRGAHWRGNDRRGDQARGDQSRYGRPSLGRSPSEKKRRSPSKRRSLPRRDDPARPPRYPSPSERQPRDRSRSPPKNGLRLRPLSKSKSLSRPLSGSPERLNARMPHNEPVIQEHSGEVTQAEVLERPALRGGEPVWQAEIAVPQGGINHSGRARVITIRGPPRKTREQADNDAKELTEALPEGPKAVRSLANALHRS